MSNINLINLENYKSYNIPENIIDVEFNPKLISLIIHWQNSNRRSGISKVLVRSEISGSRKKIVSLNKKVRKLGLKQVFSSLVKLNKLAVGFDTDIKKPKSNDIIKALSQFEEKVLIIGTSNNINVKLSCNNLVNVNFLMIEGINIIDILKHNIVIFTPEALSCFLKKVG
jgi:ribosomal protein L4